MEWNTISAVVSAICAIISTLSVYFLVKEKSEKNRPYLQISFELVRSSLACLTMKNVGTVPLRLRAVNFDESFLKQLPKQNYDMLITKKDTDIIIFPNQQWVFCLGIPIYTIVQSFKVKKLGIEYNYSRINRKELFQENTTIDYNEYVGYLDYISQSDEFKRSIDNMGKEIHKLTEKINN